MKPTRYLLLVCCLAAVLSCTKEDEKPQYEPNLLDIDDFNGDLQDTVQGHSFDYHALQLLDEQYLLIPATLPFRTSKLYRYNLFDGSILPMEYLIIGDLEYTTISEREDELVLIDSDNFKEVLVIGIENMMVKRRFPIESFGSYHHMVGSNLYYRNYTGQHIQIYQLNIDNGEQQVVYNVDRSTEREGGELTAALKWEIYESANQTARLLTIDRLPSGKIGLVHYGLKEDQLIWQVGLEEFEAAGALPPKEVILGEGQVYAVSDDYISCRSMMDGALIWSIPRMRTETYYLASVFDDNYPVSVFDDKVIAVGEDFIEAFDTSDGRLVWSIKRRSTYDSSSSILDWNKQPSIRKYGNYLIINLIPIDIQTGHILWSKRPEVEGRFKVLQTNHPYVDLNNAVMYYLFEGVMYKWELPPID